MKKKKLRAKNKKNKAKVRKPKAKVRKPKAKVRRPKAKVRRPKAKVRKPKAKVRRPKPKARRPKAGKLRPKSRRIKFKSRKTWTSGARSSKKTPAAKAARQTILILDFGSQYTQLIARRVRENKVFSRIIPYNTPAKDIQAMQPKGLILSGGPASVTRTKRSPYPDKGIFKLGVPVLGVCYGMQAIAELLGGKVKSSREREFGKTELFIDDNRCLLQENNGL